MTVLKTAAMTVLAWGALASFANAAPLSWFGPSSTSAWYANQSLANGGFYAPANSPPPVFYNYNWYNNPTYLSSLGSPAQPAAATAAATYAAPAPSAAAAISAATPSASAVNAYVNLGNGPYAEAGNLTTGTPQAWYNSPSVVSAFGGTPNSSQQASFVQSVMSDVQQTFQNSGINISLTSDPSVPAQHMLSVVSGANYPGNPGAIGITTVGGNGFSFIDKLSYATSPDQLAWAVAHNVSHELMHALGVGTHPDTTGNYLDAATANWSLLTDPNTRFSPQAVQLIQAAMNGSPLTSPAAAQLLSLSRHNSKGHCPTCSGAVVEGAQLLEAPVPEPATIAIWTISALGAMLTLRRKAGRRPA